eukprot:110473-Amphidinium_carterae.1
MFEDLKCNSNLNQYTSSKQTLTKLQKAARKEVGMTNSENGCRSQFSIRSRLKGMRTLKPRAKSLMTLGGALVGMVPQVLSSSLTKLDENVTSRGGSAVSVIRRARGGDTDFYQVHDFLPFEDSFEARPSSVSMLMQVVGIRR